PDTYDFCGPGWGWAQCTPFRRYKTWTYEGGIATPLIVRWPGVTHAKSITHETGHVIDLLPTFLDLANGDYPSEHAGQAILPVEDRSVRPILEGDARPEAPLYWLLFGNRAVRQGKWKLVRGVDAPAWELYDMQAARTE